MRIYPVPSSNIAAVGFDPAVKRLRVYFVNAGAITSIYHYEGVAAAITEADLESGRAA